MDLLNVEQVIVPPCNEETDGGVALQHIAIAYGTSQEEIKEQQQWYW